MTDQVCVTAENLGHRFPGTDWLFSDLNFSLNPGEVICVTGPSGSGKSTLLSLLAGWEKPTSGAVHRTGVERVQWVFQNPYGVPHRSVADHVGFPLLQQGLSRLDADTKARDLLARFGLGATADREFSALSGGEAQRLMLARALAVSPDLLLVDEPTAQLDRVMAASVAKTLTHLAQEDVIVVIASHDTDVVSQASYLIDLGVTHAEVGSE
ncbi:MAG: ATP-binding cassette domain-containing protein [Propionibacteriaceae bacterium]|nr:ATP-binding cassette domain-containing protein [Propionibacteriaceae bacterium]